MTTITLKIPDAGAVRLIEESIKAGMAPDQFIAKLIEERLRQPSPGSTPAAQQPILAASKKKATVKPPKLNAEGIKALQRIFGGMPGQPPPGFNADNEVHTKKSRKVPGKATKRASKTKLKR